MILLHQINPRIPYLTQINEHLCLHGMVEYNCHQSSGTVYFQSGLFINYQMSQIWDLWIYLMQHDHDPILFCGFFQQYQILNLNFNFKYYIG